MAGAGETEERIAGADLSRAGSPAARMEGKWEKDTAGTSHGTRVLCPNGVAASHFSPGWAGGTGRLRDSPQQTRAPRGAHWELQQMDPAGQLGSSARSHQTATCDQGCSQASASPCARSWLQESGPNLVIINSGLLQIRHGALPTWVPGFV